MSRPTTSLTAALAERSGTDPADWYPVFKARYGMLVAMGTIRDIVGDGTVLTQLFTCCTAVDPIVASGLTPCYGDVDRDTLCLDPGAVDTAQGPLRVAMLQHTFGLIDQESSRRFARAARRAGALVMEDCAHCATRMARDGEQDGRDGRPVADISVHSFGVEKILPTRFGGAVWINPSLSHTDPTLDRELRSRLSHLPKPGARLDLVTRLYVNENRVFSRLGGLGAAMRRGCTRLGLYEPPIADAERRGRLRYPAYAPTPWIERRAADAIERLDANERTRHGNVTWYRDWLKDAAADGRLHMPAAVTRGAAQPLLRFPLFADDTATAERLIDAVRATGVYAERWYRPELFPGVTDAHAYGLDMLDRATVPVSGDLVATALCLPTDLSVERARRAVDALLDAL